MPAEDYLWLHSLTAPRNRTATVRRLAQEGVAPSAAERGVSVVATALTSEGLLTRRELRDRLARAGVPTAGQALVHILMLACLEGIAVRGPMRERDHAYVLVDDWLPNSRPPERRDAALAELARRYLAGHGPASDRDLARWAGLPLRDARRGLAAVATELDERPDGLVDLAGRGPPGELPPPLLLGPFDPLLHGWRARQPILGTHQERVVAGGMFRPIALIGGRAAATWRIRASEVVLEPFRPLQTHERSALEAEAADVLTFLAAQG